LDKKTVLNIIEQFKQSLISKGISINRIVLFGSYANNTQRPDSDIDLIVISESFKDMDYWQRIDVMAEAIYEIFEPIEAIAMTESEWKNKTFMAAHYAQNGLTV
jgi:predicted nucleotidyltransferase